MPGGKSLRINQDNSVIFAVDESMVCTIFSSIYHGLAYIVPGGEG